MLTQVSKSSLFQAFRIHIQVMLTSTVLYSFQLWIIVRLVPRTELSANAPCKKRHWQY